VDLRILWTVIVVNAAFVSITQAARTEDAAPAIAPRVDAAVSAVLARTGVPSASIALVREGKVAYVHAYGWAQLSPQRAATPSMRYAIGSVTKEFVATGILMLQEHGELSIEDPVGKWFPGLGPAAGVNLRALLSHTSGILDYWPQDYDFPDALKPIKPDEILTRWAKRPLDFEAGTAWQYSNTGYTVAGLIAERVARQSLFEFLRSRIFQPLGMLSVWDFDASPMPSDDAVGYTHYALGPPRRAAKAGTGWAFAAGQLAMTASDLARWDVALIHRQLLNAANYRDLTTEVQLTNGVGSGYALGLQVSLESGRRVLMHGGELDGFTAHNRIYPDDGIAIVVLTNEDATGASEAIANKISELMFAEASLVDGIDPSEAQRLFLQLQRGRIDVARLTPNGRSYFTPRVLEDYRSSLAPLGEPSRFELTRSYRRGGLIRRAYEATFADKKVGVVVLYETNGKIEQYIVSAK
jgi:D-alanyl-D-alanine carboxypeptidase